MFATWSLVLLTFLKPAWTSGSSGSCWSLAWRILSITLLACEMSAVVLQFEHSLALPFFGIGMKTDFFQSCGHCWVFQICWHIECITLTALFFRIWNSSPGIPSPPLALFVVVLPKVHLTSHSRTSGLGDFTFHFSCSTVPRSAFYHCSSDSCICFLICLLASIIFIFEPSGSVKTL